MSEPLVSVVIPAYNHERFIGAAMRSVLEQTAADLELIVIDDGSTDGTWDVINSFKDPRIRAFRQANADAYNTLNRGLALARGRFHAILNSDDVYAPDRLEVLLAEQKARGAACLFTDVAPMDAAGRTISEPAHPWNVWHAKNRNFYFACGDLYTAFLKGNFMVTTSNLFLAAEAARATGPFAPYRFLHDYDFIFRVMLARPGKVFYLHDRRLLFYRLHGGNTLGQGAITAREQDQMIIRKYMLLGLPETCAARAAAGADRLVELERELWTQRALLNAAGRGARLRRLAGAVRSRLRGAFGR